MSGAVVRPTERQVWTREDFPGDVAIGREGVSLQVEDAAWTVRNRSTRAQDVYLLDLRFGRRRVPPTGSLRLRRLHSWVLLPSSAGAEQPHVITVGMDRSARPAGARRPGTDPDRTANAGDPGASTLVAGLEAVSRILQDRDRALLAGAFARPYFDIATSVPAAESKQQVARCLPGHPDRGERLVNRIRRELGGGTGTRMTTDRMFELLIENGIVTYAHVRDVRHAPGCGHDADRTDPAAHGRRGGHPPGAHGS